MLRQTSTQSSTPAASSELPRCELMDPHCHLPSLRGIVRLGGQTKAASISCYDVEFYPYTLPGVDPVFAICGATFTIVCRCVLEKNATIKVLRWFENKELKGVNYNSVAWSQAENGDPLVCVTGGISQISVLNVRSGQLVQTLVGHGDDINDLAVSPVDPTILASCSIDHSIRIWSLDPAHKEKPLAAICYGEGHRDQVLTLAYHRKGRFILSAGMDTKINLWVVPENIKHHAGTDKPAMIHYPHFSTTEIHTDFVDCVQWYNDYILSHASREDKIVLWRIQEFSSDATKIPPPPIPTSAAVSSRTPVTIPANSISSTRSAWGGRFERLLQFELPDTNQFYIRFSVFHELDRHPILIAGNERSRVFLWDLQRLETPSTGDEVSQNEGVKAPPFGLPRHVREESTVSNVSGVSAGSSSTMRAKHKVVKENVRDMGICSPFRSLKAHKIIEIPKYQAFALRHFSWSRDGQWCVGVGDCGSINLFHRWDKGVPPLSTDFQVDFPSQEPSQNVDITKIKDAVMEICESYELRRQMAEDQGFPFDEVLSVILSEYIAGLSQDEQAFARSLEQQQKVRM